MAESHYIPPEAIDQAGRCYLKLKVTRTGDDSSTSVEGFGSQDGANWALIHAHTFSHRLDNIGLAAASHNDRNTDGTPIKHLFGNFRQDGSSMEAEDLTKV